MTECAPVISTSLSWNNKEGSVGKLMPNCEAKTVDEDSFVFLTGRKKNLIITPNGENISPEEIENKLSENRLIQEILIRDSEGVIEAEIFPDYEYANKKKIKDIPEELQKMIDAYNQKAPLYKRVFEIKIRETEFEKIQQKNQTLLNKIRILRYMKNAADIRNG